MKLLIQITQILFVLICFSACKKPLQATFQRTPQEQFDRSRKQLSTNNQQLPISNEQLAMSNYLNTNPLTLISNSSLSIPALLIASTNALPVSQRVIIKQNIKTLKFDKIEQLIPAKITKKTALKSRGNNNFWDSWDKNLKLGVILTGLLVLLAILGVGGLALGIVSLFALWYLVRGLKREL